MVKNVMRDVQVLVTMIQYQDSMEGIVEKDTLETQDCDLLKFYIMRMHYLSKRLSKKTLDMVTLFNDFIFKLIMSDVSGCIPMLSNEEIRNYAEKLSDAVAKDELEKIYTACAEKSANME